MTDDMRTKKPADITPWVERYRPNSLEDISHQTEVVQTLQNAVTTGRLPHLLFYGPPGTGKTSVALALCKQLWHPSIWRRRVLELNASDERGISVVRDKIKHFASLAVGSGQLSSSANKAFFTKNKAHDTIQEDEMKAYPNPPFKIIILDESDSITPDAQAALRRIIEAHSRVTRFILICNYVTRIIEPLASRCAKFRFQPLPPLSMKARLKSIAETENCSTKDDELDYILQLCEGDMRRAVTTLQSAHALGGHVDKDALAEMAGLPPFTVVDTLWSELESNSFTATQLAVEDVCAGGYSALVILVALSKRVVTSTELSELFKSNISIRIAEAEKNLVDGADEYLQLMTVCSLIMTCMEESKTSKC